MQTPFPKSSTHQTNTHKEILLSLSPLCWSTCTIRTVYFISQGKLLFVEWFSSLDPSCNTGTQVCCTQTMHTPHNMRLHTNSPHKFVAMINGERGTTYTTLNSALTPGSKPLGARRTQLLASCLRPGRTEQSRLLTPSLARSLVSLFFSSFTCAAYRVTGEKAWKVVHIFKKKPSVRQIKCLGAQKGK